MSDLMVSGRSWCRTCFQPYVCHPACPRRAQLRAGVRAVTDKKEAAVTSGGAGNHGPNRYRAGCRCDVCREGQRVRMKAQRGRRTPEDAPVHGTPSTYTNYGCRCEACTAAHSAWLKVKASRRLALKGRRVMGKHGNGKPADSKPSVDGGKHEKPKGK